MVRMMRVVWMTRMMRRTRVRVGAVFAMHVFLPEFGGQQGAVSMHHGSFQNSRRVSLFQRMCKYLRWCMTQLGILANGFQPFNRVCHVFPLFPVT